MKKGIIYFGILSAFIILMISLPLNSAHAQIADGSYKVNYEMKENSSNNTSIADGYFASPASLTAKDGKQKIRLTVTGAEMIKSLSTPKGPVTVISDSGETRVVEFSVDGDLSKPLPMTMHIVVPKELLPPNGYDMTHTARAFFNVSGLPSATKKTAEKKQEPKKETKKPVEKIEAPEKEPDKVEEKQENDKEKEAQEKKKQEELEKEQKAKELEKEKEQKKLEEERRLEEERKKQGEKEIEATVVAAEKLEQKEGGNFVWLYIVLSLAVLSGAGYGVYKFWKSKK